MLNAERAHGGAGLDTAQKNGGVASAVTMLYGVSVRFGILNTPSVGTSVCLELGTAVRADQPKVVGMVVPRIPVNVVEDEFDRGTVPSRALGV